MIFIHPQILRDDLHQEQVSKQRYNDIRNQQLEEPKPEKFRRGEPTLPDLLDETDSGDQ